LRRLALRLAICALVSWVAWRLGGVIAAMTSVALVGVLLAKPLVELFIEIRAAMRARAWAPVQGRHWAFKGIAVDVLEDDEHRRWVRASDVQKIVGYTASDASLRLTYPNGYRNLGAPTAAYFSDDALLVHLGKQNNSRALRFRHWVEREIAFPARRLRGEQGGQ